MCADILKRDDDGYYEKASQTHVTTPSSYPKVRAKIDPSSVVTPTAPRPSLRPTTSAGTPKSRPVITPSQSLPLVARSDSVPIVPRVRARANSPGSSGMGRSYTSTSTSSDVGAGPSNYARSRDTGDIGGSGGYRPRVDGSTRGGSEAGSMRPPSRAATVERIRVKANLASQPNTPTPTSRPSFSRTNTPSTSVLSRTRTSSPAPQIITARTRKTASPERIRISPTRPSPPPLPTLPTNPSLTHLQRNHQAFSAPPSPHHPQAPFDQPRSRASNLLYSPHLVHPPPLPVPPDSPNLRSVELPILTPRRSLDGSTISGGSSRLGSGVGRVDEGNLGRGDWVERDRLSGSTVVDSEVGLGMGLKLVDSHTLDITEPIGETTTRELDLEEAEEMEDVEQAKINRKVGPLLSTLRVLLMH
jgi:hypothetical protein